MKVRQCSPSDKGAVVLLTGCRRGAGCSTLALALARVAADQFPVLLIDADMNDPGLSRLLGTPRVTPVALGWEEAVRGHCSFAKPVQYLDPEKRLAFLPLRHAVREPAALLAKPALRLWVPQLRQDYSLIVLDGGLVFETGSQWAPWVDAALLVCAAQISSEAERAKAWDSLEEHGASVLGIVETFV